LFQEAQKKLVTRSPKILVSRSPKRGKRSVSKKASPKKEVPGSQRTVKSPQKFQTPHSRQVPQKSSTQKRTVSPKKSEKPSVAKTTRDRFQTPANIIPESKRTESKPKLKESSVKSKHPSVSKRQSPKSSRNIVKNSPSPTKKTNIEVDKKYRDIVQNIELINKKKAEKEQLEREREKQKQKSKPKITIKEKIVHPSKRGTSSVEKSQKISENKQLFDKHFKKYINLKDINAKKEQDYYFRHSSIYYRGSNTWTIL